MNIFFISPGGKGAFAVRVARGEVRFQRKVLRNFYRHKNIGNSGCFNIKLG
jgi:hypothetical protein